MSTDRELLELAAKATGIEIVWCDGYATIWDEEWNPLTDDGDALRLAVKLNIYFRRYRNSGFFRERVGGYVEAVRNDIEEREPVGDDPYAATRRAIVRAAAEIGKEQK